ncbi:hypothetical protein C8J57DRAFT_1528952 [Mycena rebaudengoi]|nr:hypothetical protein C8J57DRAFT_1528952 [Mycena rebaudengoi]
MTGLATLASSRIAWIFTQYYGSPPLRPRLYSSRSQTGESLYSLRIEDSLRKLAGPSTCWIFNYASTTTHLPCIQVLQVLYIRKTLDYGSQLVSSQGRCGSSLRHPAPDFCSLPPRAGLALLCSIRKGLRARSNTSPHISDLRARVGLGLMDTLKMMEIGKHLFSLLVEVSKRLLLEASTYTSASVTDRAACARASATSHEYFGTTLDNTILLIGCDIGRQLSSLSAFGIIYRFGLAIHDSWTILIMYSMTSFSTYNISAASSQRSNGVCPYVFSGSVAIYEFESYRHPQELADTSHDPDQPQQGSVSRTRH